MSHISSKKMKQDHVISLNLITLVSFSGDKSCLCLDNCTGDKEHGSS